MAHINKYLYMWIVQGYYAPYGWEDLTQSESHKETRARLREYRENEPQYPHRMIQRREPNPEWEGTQG